ncbi:endonuclease domain-containing 1 protein-like [Colossoma macropomum]|uniref:endonuclease domain-containing 1 protein-like n=1 Tax=Colossoma macropomum TaxID=42526 RepID=UPI001864DB0A|nr:endonuclease domain-containing 1 protein-like [Colossoma macropomum]
MKLLTLLLLLGFTSLTGSEVVQSFKSQCRQFFMPNPHDQTEVITPTVLKEPRYRQICQRWKGQYRYATLYDTKSRIPVYSAYTFYRKGRINRTNVWNIEPQLDLPLTPENSNMGSNFTAEETYRFKNQARSEDYQGRMTRGHVFPNCYTADQDQADSTFTLTNAAPQTAESNREWAKQVEEPMLKEIQTNCMLNKNNPAYIVTGVVPGEKWLPIQRENRDIEQGVNIPSHYWTAFTCVKDNRRIYRTYIAQQIYPLKNGYSKFIKHNMTVDELDKKLTELYKESLQYNQQFSVFKNTRS